MEGLQSSARLPHSSLSSLRVAQSQKECISQVMRYVLAWNHREPFKPVKRAVLLDLLKKLNVKPNVLPTVLSRAQSQFTKFGFEMVAVPHGARTRLLHLCLLRSGPCHA